MAESSSHPGILHRIQRSTSKSNTGAPLIAFEHELGTDPSSTLIFLGGLFDGLSTVSYVSALASRLTSGWRLVEPILSSSYRQWGISSLDDDVTEIADLVRHFKKTGSKIVLLGHSTGCQMIMHFLLNPLSRAEHGRQKVEGAILQASVSDREALVMLLSKDEYGDVCNTAQRYINDGMAGEVLPQHCTSNIFGGPTPITARRLISIASPGPDHAGEVGFFVPCILR